MKTFLLSMPSLEQANTLEEEGRMDEVPFHIPFPVLDVWIISSFC